LQALTLVSAHSRWVGSLQAYERSRLRPGSPASPRSRARARDVGSRSRASCGRSWSGTRP
jgi:hypothetical protein